jgi:hypothetical protein
MEQSDMTINGSCQWRGAAALARDLPIVLIVKRLPGMKLSDFPVHTQDLQPFTSFTVAMAHFVAGPLRSTNILTYGNSTRAGEKRPRLVDYMLK